MLKPQLKQNKHHFPNQTFEFSNGTITSETNAILYRRNTSLYIRNYKVVKKWNIYESRSVPRGSPNVVERKQASGHKTTFDEVPINSKSFTHLALNYGRCKYVFSIRSYTKDSAFLRKQGSKNGDCKRIGQLQEMS